MNTAAQGYSIDQNASEDEVERTKAAIESDQFCDLRRAMEEAANLALTPALFDITALTVLPHAVLSLLSIRPGEAVLRDPTLSNHDDLSPLSVSVLHHKPFLEWEGRFYSFYHSGFEDRISEIIEDFLLNQRPNSASAMLKRKSEHYEHVTEALLVEVLQPDKVFQNLYYPDPDNPQGLTELDRLLVVDDILFLVEIKAGGLSAGARRGAPSSLSKDLTDLIIKGQQQSERAERYVRSAPEVHFFDQTGVNVVHTVRSGAYRRIFRIVVTREPLGWVGAKIAMLSVLDPKLNDRLPWHVSVDDLRPLVDLFKGQSLRFVHFLEQRLKASSERALIQHDELEHVALYNAINEYHESPIAGADRFSFDPSYMREIDFYFAEKYAATSPIRPEQKLSPFLKDLLGAMETSGLNGRFEAASFLLSLGQDGRDMLENGLQTLHTSRERGGQPSLRIPVTETSSGITITYACDEHWEEDLRRSSAQMEISACTRWLIIRLGDEKAKPIIQIERINADQYPEVEVRMARSQLEIKTASRIKSEKPGRNDPCPCGSGKKYKRCHGF